MKCMNIRHNDVGERGIFGLLAALIERFDRWAARRLQCDREQYLAQSKDVFELERRIRELERNHSDQSFGRRSRQ